MSAERKRLDALHSAALELTRLLIGGCAPEDSDEPLRVPYDETRVRDILRDARPPVGCPRAG